MCDSPYSVNEAVHPARTHRKSTSTTSSELRQTTKGPVCTKDLYTGRTIEYKSGLDTFIFPTPSPLLRSPSPRSSPALAPRSATFQHLRSDLQHESPRIGMAIGSPSHAPPSWERSQPSDGISARIQPQMPSEFPPAVPEKPTSGKQSKERPRVKKASSWKLFSNIFMFRKTTKPAPAAKDAYHRIKLEVPRNPPTSPTSMESDVLSPMVPPSSASPGVTRRLHSRDQPDARAQTRCESRGSVRTSFTRLLRSPCERATPSSSPWRATFFRGERDRPKSPMLLSPHLPTLSRTPRLELDIPAPELERYSVMFSQLLAQTSSNDSKPSLLERRLSRLPPATKAETNVREAQAGTNNQASSRLTRSLSIKVDERRTTSGLPVPAVHRPRPIARSQTAPILEASKRPSDSPTGSASYSEASLPPTPTTINACTDTTILEDKEPAWNVHTSQPVIMSSPDVTGLRVDRSIDLEQQMVQVSVARQVSISRARSRIRRTVSTKQPQMVDLMMAKNRKSEAGILDSVDLTVDPGEE